MEDQEDMMRLYNQTDWTSQNRAFQSRNLERFERGIGIHPQEGCRETRLSFRRQPRCLPSRVLHAQRAGLITM